MIPINKEELIKQYINYRKDFYSPDFKDMDKFDRVEKLLKCHGWLSEAEEAFEPYKEEIRIKELPRILKERI